MKINLLAILLFVFLFERAGIAQQINIKEVDQSGYPFINVTIEIPESESVDFSKLQILESDEAVAYKVDSGLYTGRLTMLCFLVDDAFLTNSVSKSAISNILINASERLKKNDLLNVIFTENQEKANKCIHPLSFEFTADFKGLINQFETSLLTGTTIVTINDLSCPINEALNFIQNKSTAPCQKYIVLLKNKKSTINDWPELQTKADANLVSLKKIELPDRISEFNEHEVLQFAFSQLDSLQLTSAMGTPNLKSYLLSFYTKQTNKINSFELSYKNQKLTASFRKPDSEGLLSQDMVFILVIIFLLLLSILLTINMIRLRKKRKISKGHSKQIGLKLKEQTSKISATLDPKKTNYGSITPYITIELDGQIEKFDLKKLRTTIGRHSDNDILIANLTISNHHATVTNEGGVFYIQDNDSTNGTFVNDLKITKTAIKPEDSVRLGKAKLCLTY